MKFWYFFLIKKALFLLYFYTLLHFNKFVFCDVHHNSTHMSEHVRNTSLMEVLQDYDSKDFVDLQAIEISQVNYEMRFTFVKGAFKSYIC